MTQLRAALRPWAFVLVGVYLLLVGIMSLTSLAVSPVVVGVIAVVAGLCCLAAS